MNSQIPYITWWWKIKNQFTTETKEKSKPNIHNLGKRSLPSYSIHHTPIIAVIISFNHLHPSLNSPPSKQLANHSVEALSLGEANKPRRTGHAVST